MPATLHPGIWDPKMFCDIGCAFVTREPKRHKIVTVKLVVIVLLPTPFPL